MRDRLFRHIHHGNGSPVHSANSSLYPAHPPTARIRAAPAGLGTPTTLAIRSASPQKGTGTYEHDRTQARTSDRVVMATGCGADTLVRLEFPASYYLLENNPLAEHLGKCVP